MILNILEKVVFKDLTPDILGDMLSVLVFNFLHSESMPS